MKTNDQAGGATDLLTAIYGIQIRNEEKISDHDREFCQRKQDQLYTSLDQINHWYAIFKAEADKYADTRKIVYNENGSIKNTYLQYGYHSKREDYTPFEFWPFKEIDKLVDLNFKAIDAFADDIVGYFNGTYKVNVRPPSIDKEKIPMGFRPSYMSHVDLVIEHLGGKGFREVAEEELMARFIKAASPGRWSKVKPELKGDKIVFPNLLYYEDYSWQKENHLQYSSLETLSNICAGVIFGSTGSLSGGVNHLCGFEYGDVDFSNWYDLATANPDSVKLYKNGRIDVKFTDKDKAEACFRKLRLDSIVTETEN
mgnify:CR=1 FL=1